MAQSVPTKRRAVHEGTPVAPSALVQKSCTWAKVIAEGKKRKIEEGVTRGAGVGKKKVGGQPDLKENRGKGVPMMVKVGGVRWDDGISRVIEGLKEAGLCSVRRFVAVLGKRKEAGWVTVVEKVEEKVGGMEMNVEGAVAVMGEKVAGVERSVTGVAEE
ncbi:hypothetical protein L873DRAFT_1848947 [Choiromyces venosus 120613-1]|uniref:Uncharacterized protein n=1 Tax=Choiromyces venosus 120613-1 TaxID=1336337 RepID=A0A3N4IZC9_9PEZI|nr:hypothetical protein L873DRAFT_1848947 [Choiromyces venosus 120613-1]